MKRVFATALATLALTGAAAAAGPDLDNGRNAALGNVSTSNTGVSVSAPADSFGLGRSGALDSSTSVTTGEKVTLPAEVYLYPSEQAVTGADEVQVTVFSSDVDRNTNPEATR